MFGFFRDHIYSIIALTLPDMFYRPKKKAENMKNTHPSVMNVKKSAGLFLNVDVSSEDIYLKQM